MKASEHLAQALAAEGVTHAFEVVGGTIAHLLDALARSPATELVSMRHEQAAAFAADGYARITGAPGVALATSGPGATNLLTGVAGCHFDSVPAVFVTGQVRRDELTGDRGVRQQGFQETDVVAMARPVTKAAWQAGSAAELPGRIAEAFATARSGRPGPVLLDIPSELGSQDVGDRAPVMTPTERPSAPDPAAVEAALAALERAERPLVLVGGGLRAAGSFARASLRAWIGASGLPVVSSLHAVDALPASDPQRVGLIGTYGNRWANLALGRCDVLLVLGSRLDIRQTGADTAFFGDREIHHVDADPAELGNNIDGTATIEGDLSAFLRQAIARGGDRVDRPGWVAEIAELRERWPDVAEQVGITGINPNAFMHELSAASEAAAAYVLDVGQHQMWAAQSLDLTASQRCLTSGGLGAMGYALPAAIGACFGARRAPVVVIAGDGGFQLNLQELQTVAHHRLPLKIVVLDNGAHGMVRQFQASYFDRRFVGTQDGYSAPDFVAVARAFGIDALAVSDPAAVGASIDAAWADPDEPFLLHVKIDPEAGAYPKIAFGLPLTEMEPHATPIPLDRDA